MQKKMESVINQIKQNYRKIEAILFICSIAYCFQGTITVQAIVGAAWVARAALQFLLDFRGNRCSRYTNDCIFTAAIFLLPQLVIHLYTMFLVLLGVTSVEVLTTNVVTYLAILLVIASIYLFDKRAMGYIFYALAFSWFFCLIKAVFTHGIGIVPDAIVQGWFGASVGHENYLELDAVVLSVGYYLVCFLFSSEKTKKESLLLTLLLAIIFLIGVKRIVILAILLVAVCYWIIPKKNENTAHRISVFAGWLALIVCVAYIFVLSLGDIFYETLDKLGIDTMARNYFYKHIMSLTEFSPAFLGFGRGSVKIEMLRQFEPYSHVHSDIIKMFFEIGFVPFLGWLYFNLVFAAKCFEKEYGKSAAIFYLITMAYTFALYLTDNTENYFVCIVIRSIMPMGYAIASKKTGDNCIRKL